MQKTCYWRIRIRHLQKALTMLIEEKYKYEDTGSSGVNPLSNLSYPIRLVSVLLSPEVNLRPYLRELQILFVIISYILAVCKMFV